jgi:hypothetical protein
MLATRSARAAGDVAGTDEPDLPVGAQTPRQIARLAVLAAIDSQVELPGFRGDPTSGKTVSWRGREPFFSSLKKERVKQRIYKSRGLASGDISDYIESLYNPLAIQHVEGYP